VLALGDNLLAGRKVTICWCPDLKFTKFQHGYKFQINNVGFASSLTTNGRATTKMKGKKQKKN
jgi:hypothetical protein